MRHEMVILDTDLIEAQAGLEHIVDHPVFETFDIELEQGERSEEHTSEL